MWFWHVQRYITRIILHARPRSKNYTTAYNTSCIPHIFNRFLKTYTHEVFQNTSATKPKFKNLTI